MTDATCDCTSGLARALIYPLPWEHGGPKPMQQRLKSLWIRFAGERNASKTAELPSRDVPLIDSRDEIGAWQILGR